MEVNENKNVNLSTYRAVFNQCSHSEFKIQLLRPKLKILCLPLTNPIFWGWVGR